MTAFKIAVTLAVVYALSDGWIKSQTKAHGKAWHDSSKGLFWMSVSVVSGIGMLVSLGIGIWGL